jgi:hypothetical protein
MPFATATGATLSRSDYPNQGKLSDGLILGLGRSRALLLFFWDVECLADR